VKTVTRQRRGAVMLAGASATGRQMRLRLQQRQREASHQHNKQQAGRQPTHE